MPSRGTREAEAEFEECADLLRVIVDKYETSHDIVIGGDLNADLNLYCPSLKRTGYVMDLIQDYSLLFNNCGKTFVNSVGVECSEIDYFLIKTNTREKYSKKEIIKDIDTNVSDHYPISINIRQNLKGKLKQEGRTSSIIRTKWDKIDAELFSKEIAIRILSLNYSELETVESIEDFALKTMGVMKETIDKFSQIVRPPRSKPKLKVWTPDISEALKLHRTAFQQWSMNGKPRQLGNELLVTMKDYRSKFRAAVRCEQARRAALEKNNIINTRMRDAKLFSKLVNSKRKSKSNFIEDLNVDGIAYSGAQSLAEGFESHFRRLAEHSSNQNYDSEYHETVIAENTHIKDLVKDQDLLPISPEELQKAINSINRGKSADTYGLTIESVLKGGPVVKQAILRILNAILASGEVPGCLKLGVLTPVYKNKGSRNDAVNYRGITVLPVFEKLLETVIKGRIVSKINSAQSVYQRGFTAKTSPLHAALIVEELTRNSKDSGSSMDLIFLDAKAAFDVVDHQHLMRRVFHCGIDNKLWSVIDSLHSGAKSVVRWNNLQSDPFDIQQGVRQGGILSTDLYKLYINPLLKRLEISDNGCLIGNIRCNASACADDVTLNSLRSLETNVLINMAEDFANCNRYTLQPKKTEALKVIPNHRRVRPDEHFEIYGNKILNAETSTHLGLKRGVTVSDTATENVTSNIQKARRAAYSFMPTGFHGSGGLDVPTLLHIFKMYVMPILNYGLEIILPNKTLTDKLELFQKSLLKQLFNLPSNAPDVALYMLSGIPPVECQIHKKAIILYNNICLQPENSVERRLAERQLTVKDIKSNSWFIQVRRLFWRYGLGEPEDLLEKPLRREEWKKTVNKVLHEWWLKGFHLQTKHMKSLKYLNTEILTLNKPHPLLQKPSSSSRDANRQITKLKFMCGTYILQTNRAKFNQNIVDSNCQLCGDAPETLAHLIFNCDVLSEVRAPILEDIKHEMDKLRPGLWDAASEEQRLRSIIDCTHLCRNINKAEVEKLDAVEYHCRRLLFALHSSRYRELLILGRIEGGTGCKVPARSLNRSGDR